MARSHPPGGPQGNFPIFSPQDSIQNGGHAGFYRFFAPAWIVAEICQFKPLYRSKTAPTIGVQSVLGRFPRRKGLYFGIFVMVFGVAGSEAGRTLTRGWI